MSRARTPGILLGLAFAAALATGSHCGQERTRADDPGPIPVDPSLGQYDGAQSCQQCHTAPLPVKDSDAYVALTEFKIWKEQDKHSKAFEVLKDGLSVQMGKTLGYEPTKAAQCLNCHAMNVPPAMRAPSFTIESGVSCDACHGPSEKWDREHRFPPWRTKPMAEKKKLGFADVRDPLTRAKLCSSCHVGDQRLGRFVTHEMFAAGHPPLPGFELATFCNAMPRHWRRLPERNSQVQEVLKQSGLVDPEELSDTRAVLVGAMVALRESLRLAQEHSQSQRPWPEFALYDCYACHHDLRSSSWRQRAERQIGAPGRPMPSHGLGALARIGLELLGEKPVLLNDQLRPLREAFSAQPFGRRELIAPPAGAAADWAERQAERLNKMKVRKAEASRVLHALLQRPEREVLDYDAARQLAWAFRVVYDERFPKEARSGAAHSQIDLLLTEIDRELALQLPAREANREQALADRLTRVNGYDPERVRKQFQRLKAVLPKE